MNDTEERLIECAVVRKFWSYETDSFEIVTPKKIGRGKHIWAHAKQLDGLSFNVGRRWNQGVEPDKTKLLVVGKTKFLMSDLSYVRMVKFTIDELKEWKAACEEYDRVRYVRKPVPWN